MNVRFYLSIFPFPRWSPTKQTICSIKRSRQNWRNHSEQNSHPVCVLKHWRTPKRAMWLCNNSQTLSVEGFRKKVCQRLVSFIINWNYQVFVCTRSYFKRSRKNIGNFTVSFHSCWQFTILTFWVNAFIIFTWSCIFNAFFDTKKDVAVDDRPPEVQSFKKCLIASRVPPLERPLKSCSHSFCDQQPIVHVLIDVLMYEEKR